MTTNAPARAPQVPTATKSIEGSPRVTEQKLRIVFLTPEEPSVMPIFFERVIPELRAEIAAVAVVSPIYKKSSWTGQAKRFIDSFGVRDFAIEAAQYAGYKAADLVRRLVPVGRYRSVKSIARHHGLRLLTPADVNAGEFLDELRELQPDLVVSVSCPQIFKQELLELPRLGCINLHSALLPHYRGMLPTFWVLAKGEEKTGVTIHHMSAGIDGGGIVLQREISISAQETLHSLMRKCKAVAAELTIEAIGRFRRGSATTAPNPADDGSYYSFPTRDDVREFRAQGRALR
jgi:methionyl-tRNA formyltransferase